MTKVKIVHGRVLIQVFFDNIRRYEKWLDEHNINFDYDTEIENILFHTDEDALAFKLVFNIE